MKTKICGNPKCNIEKPLSEFGKDKQQKDGYSCYCKECKNKRGKKYYDENQEKINKKHQKYYQDNKEDHNKRHIEYYKNNKPKIKIYTKKWNKENKILQNQRRRERFQFDINYKILHNLRGRLNHALNGKLKIGSTIELLGCDTNKLKQHLESQFTKGMNWDNYGLWHIDHIKPCAKYDLSKEDQQLECFHYTNLQPLWAVDNWSKGSK